MPSFVQILDFIGTFAFAISGIRLASAKRFDWFGAYIVGLATVGYAISTVLFLFVLSSYSYGKIDKKMIGIAIYAVAATVVVYLLFVYVFKIRLPGGM